MLTLIFGIVIGWGIGIMTKTPLGYQDSTGFHRGPDPRAPEQIVRDGEL